MEMKTKNLGIVLMLIVVIGLLMYFDLTVDDPPMISSYKFGAIFVLMVVFTLLFIQTDNKLKLVQNQSNKN